MWFSVDNLKKKFFLKNWIRWKELSLVESIQNEMKFASTAPNIRNIIMKCVEQLLNYEIHGEEINANVLWNFSKQEMHAK